MGTEWTPHQNKQVEQDRRLDTQGLVYQKNLIPEEDKSTDSSHELSNNLNCGLTRPFQESCCVGFLH